MPRPPLHVALAVSALAVLLGADALARPILSPVPDVVGRRAGEAERRLASAGFASRLLGPAAGEGFRVVTAQKPAAGTRARPGTVVRLTYRWVHFGSARPARPGDRKEVRVPRVQGLALREAVRRLERSGLAADTIGPTAGSRGRALVVGQNPAHGATATRGATVRLTWRYAQ